MLHVSLATVVTAVVTTNVYIVLLTICLSHRKLLLDVGYRLLALFVIFTALRLAFPFELPFTITVPLPKIISWVVSLCHIQLGTIRGHLVSLWMLFIAVWVIGTVFGVLRFIVSYCRSSYRITLYGKELTHKDPYVELLEQICREQKRKNRFRVIELPGLPSPVLFGNLSPRILVPEKFDLSKQDIYYILRHETAHHFHHDLLLKLLVKLITLIYWWDPFCRKLNDQTEAILEMRVDNSLTLMDIQLTEDYMHSLIAAKGFSLQSSILPNEFTLRLLPEDSSDILKRFSLLQHNQNTPHFVLNTLLIVITFSIYLLSYAFIGEAYSLLGDIPLPNTKEQEDLFLLSESDSYFIDNGDGSYDLYYYGIHALTTDSPEDYGPGIPVYPEEYRPQ